MLFVLSLTSLFLPLSLAGNCTSNWDCLSDTNCDGGCVNGACVYNSALDCTKTFSLYCDKWNAQCVDCRIDTDCGSNAPFCKSGQCVKCTEDYHCRNNGNCNAMCQNSACISLATTVSCPSGNICYRGLGRCFPLCGNISCTDISRTAGGSVGDYCSSDGICYDCLNADHCGNSGRCGSECKWDSSIQRTFCSGEICNSYQDCTKNTCVVNMTRYNATLHSISASLFPNVLSNILLVLISIFFLNL